MKLLEISPLSRKKNELVEISPLKTNHLDNQFIIHIHIHIYIIYIILFDICIKYISKPNINL